MCKPTWLSTPWVFDYVGFFLFPVLWIRSFLRSRIMFTTLAHVFSSPVLAEGTYIYWGGGLGLVVVIVVIVLLLRR